jgi:hypothetical protein
MSQGPERSRLRYFFYLIGSDEALGHGEHGGDGEDLIAAVVLARGCNTTRDIAEAIRIGTYINENIEMWTYAKTFGPGKAIRSQV